METIKETLGLGHKKHHKEEHGEVKREKGSDVPVTAASPYQEETYPSEGGAANLTGMGHHHHEKEKGTGGGITGTVKSALGLGGHHQKEEEMKGHPHAGYGTMGTGGMPSGMGGEKGIYEHGVGTGQGFGTGSTEYGSGMTGSAEGYRSGTGYGGPGVYGSGESGIRQSGGLGNDVGGFSSTTKSSMLSDPNAGYGGSTMESGGMGLGRSHPGASGRN